MTTKTSTKIEDYTQASVHNRFAPFWAGAMFLFGFLGVSATWIDMGWFWNSYALDITGPAWNYILFRGLFTGYKKNRWTRFFRPVTTFVVFLIVSFSIEILQYFEVYKSTFDPYDLLSYISLLIPIFILDLLQQKKSRQD